MLKFQTIIFVLLISIFAYSPVQASTACTPELSKESVKISEIEPTNFHCETGLISGGYERCFAKLKVAVRTLCVDEHIYTHVNCKVEVGYGTEYGTLTEDISTWPKEKQDVKTIIEVFDGDGEGKLDIEWRLLAVGKIVKAKLGEIKCQLY